MPEGEDVLSAGAGVLGVNLSPDSAQLMLRYLDLLYAANEHLNLTRVPREEAIPRHLLESLTVLTVADSREPAHVLDLGSGGGVPGIALAIARPDWRVVLLDARRKKAEIAAEFARSLGLGNVESVHARAEDAARLDGYRGAFDLVVARAVAPLARLVPWMAPFLRQGGLALAMKGAGVEAELAGVEPVLTQSGLRLREVRPTPVPYLEAERTLVLLERSATPTRARGRPR